MSKCKFISIFNQKGGVGKTSTAVNLAASLAQEFKKKVLVIDMDAQANATRYLLSKNVGESHKTVYHSLVSENPNILMLKELIQKTDIENLHIVPSNIFLSEAETQLIPKMGREIILRDRLGNLGKNYDYVIFDCPPSLGLISINCLVASTHIIVPIETQVLALRGFHDLVETVALVKQKLNPKLTIMGLVPTKFYGVSRANKEILEFIQTKLKKNFHVFDTVIHRSVKAEEAPGYRKPLLIHKPNSRVCLEYIELAEEVMKK